MPYLIRLLIMVCLLLISSFFVTGQSSEEVFYFGVDLSYVNEMDDCGAEYRVNGEIQDAYQIFADFGANLVRVRLWHDPDWTEYSDLDDIKRTLQRAQDSGMATVLDFHYSDNWADPGKQEIPAAWEDFADDVDALADAVYQYTYDSLMELHNDDLTPDFVQVGNETNPGMLLTIGEDLNWAKQSRLFNAGIQAVRDFSAETGTNPQIILHVAQPENTGWWFREAEAAGITDFDVIGVSYYPQWSTFSIADMGAHVGYLRQRFDKEVMVVETAYGWTRDSVDETADNIINQGVRGYSFSREGQLAFMTDLTQSLISNGGSGVVYWEPAWVSTECSTRWGQGSHWENATFFDFQNGNEVIEGINFLNAPYRFPESFADSVIDEAYGEATITDTTDDVLGDVEAFDLLALYTRSDDLYLNLALEIAGDIFSERGTYLIYIDTTGDASGADVAPGRRPISVEEPYLPEYRLDVGVKDERGTITGTYFLNAWIDNEWQEITFTGSISVSNGSSSVIEFQIPVDLIGNPESINLAVISTNRGRATTASDILGIDTVLTEQTEPLVLDTFFSVDLNE